MGYPESFNEIDRWCEELRRTHAGEDVIHALEKRIEAERDDRRLQILNWFLANEHEPRGMKRRPMPRAAATRRWRSTTGTMNG